MPPSLSLVATALNERELIEEFVEKSLRDLQAVTSDFEVVVVDDGSTDGTSEILDALSERHPRLKVIHNGVTLGTGRAYIPGFQAASKDVVFNNTVDMFFDTADLPRLLPLLEDVDVLSCYRTDLTANSVYQKLLTVVNRELVHVLFGMGLTAYQTLQFHPREFIQGVCIEARSSFISPELLYKAKCADLRIGEAPIVFHPRRKGTPKGGNPRGVYRSIRDILKYWVRWRVLNRPMPVTHRTPSDFGGLSRQQVAVASSAEA